MKQSVGLGCMGALLCIIIISVLTITATGHETEDKIIALTFDDGPHPYYTEQLLDGLRERGVKVTFFVIGENAEQYPDIIRMMEEDGHLIGNHTYSHLKLSSGNEERFGKELERTNFILEEITGETVGYCRPPYGAWNKRYEVELEMLPVLWDIDPLDWCCSNSATIVNRVVEKAHPNGVILLHDEYKTSVTAALEIVDRLQEQGYRFVTVDEIIMID